MDFFTSDLHLGHANNLRYSKRRDLMLPGDRELFDEACAHYSSTGDPSRVDAWKPSPASVEFHDAELIRRINELVREEDRLWILGDWAMPRNASEGKFRAYREAIRCRDVRLVFGNHDNRDRTRGLFTATYDAVMVYISPQGTFAEGELWDDGERRSWLTDRTWRQATKRVFLSHYCHVVWNQSHKGVYHLYGHAHGNLEPWRERHMPNALCMDIGVDCWGYAPLSFERVDAILNEKKGRVPPHVVDHHGASAID
ncbi:MAG: hypothetical protein SFZ23_02475 [Planctomycetota bacterium]|nr:hypothetical protein [Planctomycetota bacterium]